MLLHVADFQKQSMMTGKVFCCNVLIVMCKYLYSNRCLLETEKCFSAVMMADRNLADFVSEARIICLTLLWHRNVNDKVQLLKKIKIKKH